MRKFNFAEIDTIPGYIGEKDAAELWVRAKAVPANGFILELGSLFGRSAFVLGSSASFARIISVDNYSHILRPEELSIDYSPAGNAKRLKDLGVTNVVFLNCNSEEIVSQIPKFIDLLWIDANHEYEFVRSDIFGFGPLSKVIMAHDYRGRDTGEDTSPGVTKAIDEFLAKNPEWVIDHHEWSTITLIKKVDTYGNHYHDLR
jgi:hypothetical protein